MKHGWIKIHRKITEWEWYSDANTSRLFLHLIFTVNWKAGRFRGMEIPVGSTFTSYDALAKETGLSNHQVRTAIEKLKSTSNVATNRAMSGLLISVSKYESYNSGTDDGRQSNGQSNGNDVAGRWQADGNDVATIEEGKNEQEGKKEKIYKRKMTEDDFQQACSVELDFTASQKLRAVWSQWQIYRIKTNSSKRPWTAQAANIAKKNLQAWSEKHGDEAVIAKVEYAIISTHQTFFEPTPLIQFNRNQKPQPARYTGA